MLKSEFCGEFNNTLDEKGRIMIPVKLKTAIYGNTLILTKGVDKCLWLFPVDEWKKLTQQIMSNTSIFLEKSRIFLRKIIAPAHEVEIDKAGRMIIKQELREFAGLKKECVILGINNYIEIWDKEVYQEYREENKADLNNAAEEIGQIVANAKAKEQN